MEQTTMTKEDVIAQLKDAIEVQELQTQLQNLRTQLVIARFNEVKYTIEFENMTRKPDTEDEIKKGFNESTSDNKKV